MSLFDQLATELARLNSAIAGLPPRPRGNPGEISRMASQVRLEAEAAAGAARKAAGIPRAMDFTGPAAAGYAAHATRCARMALAGVLQLEAVADQLGQEAKRVAREQSDYDEKKKSLSKRRDGVAAQMRSLA